MAIQFRCPHRSIKTDGSEGSRSRDEKAALRRKVYEAPADAEWVLVEHEFNRDKVLRRKDAVGRIVEYKPYEHELGHNWQAVLTCPECGDQILVVTDQDPGTQPEAAS